MQELICEICKKKIYATTENEMETKIGIHRITKHKEHYKIVKI